MVLSPIGTFMVRMDTALAGSVDGLISAMTTNMAGPIVMAAVVYYGVQGLKLANGDPEPLQGFWPQLIRIGVVIWLSTNLPAFNQWVRSIFFVGLPNALVTAIGSSTGTTATTVNATAAVFDGIWNQVWVVVGTSWMQAGLSVTGIISGLSGFFTALICGLGLCIMALVYVSARMVLAVLVCMAPVIIGCAMFQVTRPIFERAVGKAISLILLQAMGLIILQILLLGDQWLMAQVTTSVLASVGGANGLFSESLQGLAALCLWFIAGAFAMWNLPAVAYSIGGGIALDGGTSMIAMALMRAGGGGGGGSGRDASFNGGGGAAPLSLSVARPEVSGGGGSASLPPPRRFQFLIRPGGNMRHVLALVVLAGLTGCAGEYSKVPEPIGEWVPANPASLMVQAPPPRPPVRRVVWRRRPRAVPVAHPMVAAAAPVVLPTSDKVAKQ